MKWESNQRHTFFGFTLVRRGKTLEEVPRWLDVTVDINEAVAAVGDILEAFWASLSWPGVPPLSGGLLDSWPNRMREGLAVCRAEWAAVMAHKRWRERKE